MTQSDNKAQEKKIVRTIKIMYIELIILSFICGWGFYLLYLK